MLLFSIFRSAKVLSGKATERKNKAVKATPSKCSKRQACSRANLNIKQGGKGIKQC